LPSLAPVSLFVFRRPRHTLKVLQALSRNTLADQTQLHIFCDGPGPGAGDLEKENILAVRKIARQEKWCASVTLHESPENIGLAGSIVKGVTELVDEYGRVIVLEDDIVTSKGFLLYMNQALDMYAEDKHVFQVSGFMVPTKLELEPSGFFRAPGSWGWATWKRAWQSYEQDIDVILQHANSFDRHVFNLDSTYDYHDQVLRNSSGEINTWTVRFYTSILVNNGLCLYPAKSLVKNIGFDQTATNTRSSKSRHIRSSLLKELNLSRIPIEENPDYCQAFLDFYRYQNYLWGKPTIAQRVKGKVRSLMRR